MTPCTTQSEKVDTLTRWPWRWPRMTLYHTWLKTIWKIKLNDILHSSNWKSWFLTFLELYRPYMTLYACKSDMNENYIKKWVDWHPAQFNLIKLIFDLSWPLPTLYDFVSWKIIHDWKLLEKLSWLTPCKVQSDKVDFWAFLTFNHHLWPLEILIR